MKSSNDLEVIQRLRNFGEEVYREFHDIWTVSLQEIDAATEGFMGRDVKCWQLGRTKKRLTELVVGEHGFKGIISIDVQE